MKLDDTKKILQEVLEDLKFCVDSFEKIESYYLNSLAFAKRYIS